MIHPAHSAHVLPPRSRFAVALALLAGSAPLFVAACGKDGASSSPSASSAGSSSAAPSASSGSAPAGSSTGSPAASSDDDARDEIKPVYPITDDPPDPAAQKLCAILHDLPSRRKAECCSSTQSVVFTAECVRTLSYALRQKAVTVSEAEIDQCAAAMAKSLEGCAWTSPMSPGVPAACDGIVHGALKEKERCRSSLECADGLRCRGVGPTHVGVCAPPLAAGGLCAIAVDPLAVHTRQNSFELHHPECTGYCGRRRCAEIVPLGGACDTSAECGGKNLCIRGKCSDTPAPGAGKPCLLQLCAEGVRCIKGTCVTPKQNGEPCQTDLECRSTCKRTDGGTKGVCGNYCGE